MGTLCEHFTVCLLLLPTRRADTAVFERAQKGFLWRAPATPLANDFRGKEHDESLCPLRQNSEVSKKFHLMELNSEFDVSSGLVLGISFGTCLSVRLGGEGIAAFDPVQQMGDHKRATWKAY